MSFFCVLITFDYKEDRPLIHSRLQPPNDPQEFTRAKSLVVNKKTYQSNYVFIIFSKYNLNLHA